MSTQQIHIANSDPRTSKQALPTGILCVAPVIVKCTYHPYVGRLGRAGTPEGRGGGVPEDAPGRLPVGRGTAEPSVRSTAGVCAGGLRSSPRGWVASEAGGPSRTRSRSANPGGRSTALDIGSVALTARSDLALVLALDDAGAARSNLAFRIAGAKALFGALIDDASDVVLVEAAMSRVGSIVHARCSIVCAEGAIVRVPCTIVRELPVVPGEADILQDALEPLQGGTLRIRRDG